MATPWLTAIAILSATLGCGPRSLDSNSGGTDSATGVTLSDSDSAATDNASVSTSGTVPGSSSASTATATTAAATATEGTDATTTAENTTTTGRPSTTTGVDTTTHTTTDATTDAPWPQIPDYYGPCPDGDPSVCTPSPTGPSRCMRWEQEKLSVCMPHAYPPGYGGSEWAFCHCDATRGPIDLPTRALCSDYQPEIGCYMVCGNEPGFEGFECSPGMVCWMSTCVWPDPE